jgi:integrase
MAWRTSQVKRVSKKHPSHNTALMELRFLGRIMREAVRRGFITASPLERMGIKKDRAPEKAELTDADVAAIRAGLVEWEGHLPLKDRWMTICFEIGIHQGCRLRETSVPLTDIDENAARIMFHAKRAKVYTTQLHPVLVPIIRELRAAGLTKTCVLPKMASKIWHWFFKGRPERGWNGVCPHASFHCTRVTVITRMARKGVPIQQAMAYVGHADETVHRIYQRLQADDLTRCTDALAFFPSSATQQSQGDAQTKRAAAGG